MQDLLWRNIWSADNPVEVLNEHLSLLVGRMYRPRSSVYRIRINLGLTIKCRSAFDLKPEAHLRWTRDRSRVNWEEFVRCQVRSNEAYSVANHLFSVKNKEVLMNAQSPRKWFVKLFEWGINKTRMIFNLFISLISMCHPRDAVGELRELFQVTHDSWSNASTLNSPLEFTKAET